MKEGELQSTAIKERQTQYTPTNTPKIAAE